MAQKSLVRRYRFDYSKASVFADSALPRLLGSGSRVSEQDETKTAAAIAQISVRRTAQIGSGRDANERTSERTNEQTEGLKLK